MHSLAVRSLSGQARNAGFCQSDSMAGCGFEVKVLSLGVEEADCWDVDTRGERAGHVIIGIDRGDRGTIKRSAKL